MNEVVAEAGRDLSIMGLFNHADIVVKSIMIGLLIASIVSWALAFEKMFRIWRLNREVKDLEHAATQGALAAPRRSGLISGINAAAETEWREGGPKTESGEIRDRLEVAMRGAMRKELKGIEKGVPFLATLGSAAPFIGLFGTVWGIMHSFTAIAQSKDTSLAVVAPGIAEALFATAIGLAAAIPAVIAYNQIAVALGRASDRIGQALTSLARSLARRGVEGVR
ncbi:MAG: MotA/TolQ/ExbB proton channel family protein [Hyphomicrobium sp.]